MITVRVVYLTGMKRRIFRNARLAGDWDGWVDAPMEEMTADDGCPAFAVTVEPSRSPWSSTMRGPATT